MNKKGFTLMELLAIIIIIAILALVTVPIINNVLASQRKTATKIAVDSLFAAADEYYNENSIPVSGPSGQYWIYDIESSPQFAQEIATIDNLITELGLPEEYKYTKRLPSGSYSHAVTVSTLIDEGYLKENVSLPAKKDLVLKDCVIIRSIKAPISIKTESNPYYFLYCEN